MENIFQSTILGIIQGMSEFLPISSSGHLVITPWLFGFSDPGLSFDVALHFGTLLAVVAYFWNDWLKIFQNALGKRKEGNVQNMNLLWVLVVATIPGVLAGLFLENLAETIFRNPLLIAFNLFFWGMILFLTDKYHKSKKDVNGVSFPDGMLIGLSQALAIVPGTSRSGITISMGLARGLDRVSAARFSFLMLTPIVLGASVLKFGDFLANVNFVTIFGIIFSALSGYLAITVLIKFVEKVSYQVFFWYRFVLAIIILISYFSMNQV